MQVDLTSLMFDFGDNSASSIAFWEIIDGTGDDFPMDNFSVSIGSAVLAYLGGALY